MNEKKDPKMDSKSMRQVPYRIHDNDYKVLKKLFADDSLTFQSFTRFCVDSYLKGDPLMLRLLKQNRELSAVPKDVLDRYTLSQRERQALLEEIERENDKEKVGS